MHAHLTESYAPLINSCRGPGPLALGTTTNNLDGEAAAAAVAAALGTPLPTMDNHVSILVSEDGGICEVGRFNYYFERITTGRLA